MQVFQVMMCFPQNKKILDDTITPETIDEFVKLLRHSKDGRCAILFLMDVLVRLGIMHA